MGDTGGFAAGRRAATPLLMSAGRRRMQLVRSASARRKPSIDNFCPQSAQL